MQRFRVIIWDDPSDPIEFECDSYSIKEGILTIVHNKVSTSYVKKWTRCSFHERPPEDYVEATTVSLKLKEEVEDE